MSNPERYSAEWYEQMKRLSTIRKDMSNRDELVTAEASNAADNIRRVIRYLESQTTLSPRDAEHLEWLRVRLARLVRR